MPEPLNLPRGSVRAIITLMLVVISAVAMFLPVPVGSSDVKSMFLVLTGIAVRDYFAHRKEQNEEDGPVTPEPYIEDDR